MRERNGWDKKARGQAAGGEGHELRNHKSFVITGSREKSDNFASSSHRRAKVLPTYLDDYLSESKIKVVGLNKTRNRFGRLISAEGSFFGFAKVIQRLVQ
ncbi:hypothetical protein [Novipirellula maiorica]|uniref:hypothetical protein n=1 Tax=Novipirellula maiorica TaxID=1265734 RepID=UPI0011819EF3|nr:hypothetical protein [Rhodopirellula maiorica]